MLLVSAKDDHTDANDYDDDVDNDDYDNHDCINNDASKFDFTEIISIVDCCCC